MGKAWILKILRQASAWLFWPGTALVVWGSLTPSPPDLPGPWAWDKMDHITAYFGLAAMATMVIGLKPRLALAILVLVAMGGVLEILQGYTGRDPDIHDFIAGSLGVLLGFAVAALFGGSWVRDRLLALGQPTNVPPDLKRSISCSRNLRNLPCAAMSSTWRSV